MPVRKDIVVDSWWLKGLQDGNDNMKIIHKTEDTQKVTIHNQQLLHRMFENFMDETTRRSQDEDEINGRMNDDKPALIEYLEGVDVENMKSITYKALNDQSNRLARVFIRKLGITT